MGFEKISKYAFKGILPPEGVVLHLGTRQGDDDDVLVAKTNKFFDKIKAIAGKLNLKLIAKEEEFSDHNTGDGGIDLIGLVPMPEASMGEEIVSFGQSATTKSKDEIKIKQGDADFSRWRRRIDLITIPGNFLFIAASVRQSDGKFIKGLVRNSEAAIIDRGRIISFISNWRKRSDENSGTQIIPNTIDECINDLVA